MAVTGVRITYRGEGRRYLTITPSPPGGSTAAFGPVPADWGWDPHIHPRRLLAFALDASAKPTLRRYAATPPRRPAVPLAAPEFHVDADLARADELRYAKCTLCHGTGVIAAGIAPDLRASSVPLSQEVFAHIVRDGALQVRGMPAFAEMTEGELDSLRS